MTIEIIERKDLFTVKMPRRQGMIERWLKRPIVYDVITFNTTTGGHSQGALVTKENFLTAMNEYYKRYGTYGAVKA